MFDDYDVDAWKKKKEPQMVCPQCEEKQWQSMLFIVDARRLHTMIPTLHFYDEVGIFHEHHDQQVNFFQCSRGHYLKAVFRTWCYGCIERAKQGWKMYEQDTDAPHFTVYPITDPTQISLLTGDSYTMQDGKVKYVGGSNDNHSK